MAFNGYLVSEVAHDFADGHLSRREALRRLGMLGLAMAAAGSLLAACSDDDASNDTGNDADSSISCRQKGERPDSPTRPRPPQRWAPHRSIVCSTISAPASTSSNGGFPGRRSAPWASASVAP